MSNPFYFLYRILKSQKKERLFDRINPTTLCLNYSYALFAFVFSATVLNVPTVFRIFKGGSIIYFIHFVGAVIR